MGWTRPKGYSKSKVDWAGDVLISDTSNSSENGVALDVLYNWRAIHKYPLHVFKVRLKQVSEKMDPEALAVQRLKRLPSILFKLQRKYHGKEPTMKLSQMQDIAGCRAVMSNMYLVKKIYKEGYIRLSQLVVISIFFANLIRFNSLFSPNCNISSAASVGVFPSSMV